MAVQATHQRLLQGVENHAHAVAMHLLHDNFARPHQSLRKRTTPAMAAGVASYPWSLTQVAGLLDGKGARQT